MKAAKIIIFVFVCIGVSVKAWSQEKKLIYQIKKNGSVIGNMGLSKVSMADKVILKLNSRVETRYIFKVCATSREETIFEKGLITYSSVYRDLNGNEKENKKLTIGLYNYKVEKRNKIQILNYYPIRYNMLSLYFSEPVNIKQVYSDNYQKFVNIHKLSSHLYQVNFPDGNFNQYYYSEGICHKINVHHKTYNVQIELENILL